MYADTSIKPWSFASSGYPIPTPGEEEGPFSCGYFNVLSFFIPYIYILLLYYYYYYHYYYYYYCNEFVLCLLFIT